MNKTWISLIAGIALTLAFASQASAQGGIDIGGKTAATIVFSVITNDPDPGDPTTAIIVGGTLTRTTADARWEYGAGLTVVGFLSDFGDVTLWTPSGQVRINSDLLGPEENLLAYVGFIAGVTIIDSDFGDDEVGAFGPKFGGEYYFSSNFAIQLEDALLFDTDDGISNTLTIGVKLLF